MLSGTGGSTVQPRAGVPSGLTYEDAEISVALPRASVPAAEASEQTIIQPARPQEEAEQTLLRKPTMRPKPEGGGSSNVR